MADDHEDRTTFSLKALVHKGSNRVIFVECGNDFLDVLVSFLTFPMGTIIKLGYNHSVESAPVQMGCMKNLYSSVQNVDVQQFHDEMCRDKLLCPRNAAESHCKDLKLKIDTGATQFFLCRDWNCLKTYEDARLSDDKLLSGLLIGNLSIYKGSPCETCGKSMDTEYNLSVSSTTADQHKGFVKELARLIVTDDLQVLPPSRGTSSSFLTKLQVMEGDDIIEETLNIGVNEILNLLMRSFVSKTPFTDTLLQHKPEPDSYTEIVDQGKTGEMMNKEEEEFSVKPMVSTPWKMVHFPEALQYFVNLIVSVLTPPHGFISKLRRIFSPSMEESISVKLVISKSRKMVCFAEAGEDFVNLLFSFLTVPLGFILKQMQNLSWKGCIDQLYKSVQDLDEEQHLKSNGHKSILVSPKIFPGFSYRNHILGVTEDSETTYHYSYCRPYGLDSFFLMRSDGVQVLLTDESHETFNIPLAPSMVKYTFPLKLRRSTSYLGLFKNISPQGFLKGPTMFTVTDKLIVRPISPILGFSILNELKVPLDDIKEEIVQVGKQEVLRLLVASIAGDSALTDVFIRQLKEEW